MCAGVAGMSKPAVILDARGLPARKEGEHCPQCGAGKEKRVASCGFGTPMAVCGQCGYDFQEVFRG
jgi:uncharacterized protein (DUF983 family)